MENYTRISDSIRKNKSLTATEKLLLGYLQTFQQNPDGTPTNNYCFLQQEKLAEELGESLASIKRAIKSLISKQLLFQAPERFYNGTGKQYKKRKATIMVDDNNPFQEEIQLEVPNIVSNEVKEEVEELVPVLEEEASQSMFGKQIDLYDMIEEVEAEEKIKDAYSNVTYRQFLIKEKHLEVWNVIKEYKGVINNLNRNSKQIAFDIDMDNYYEKYKDEVKKKIIL